MYLGGMSFAGHVMDMISRIKANQARRRDPFDRDVKVRARRLRPELLEPCPPEVLEAIRTKAKLEQARIRKVQLVLIAGLVLIAAFLLWLS
jgi:hypothetical protein